MINEDQNSPLEPLRRGDIAAVVYVVGKPARLFTALTADAGLHFLSIPVDQSPLDTYSSAPLRESDCQTLIAKESPVDTIAVGAIVAVYDWPKKSDRYVKSGALRGYIHSKLQQFQRERGTAVEGRPASARRSTER